MNPLALQNALRDGSATLDTLMSELSLNVYRHPTLPLVGFKYSQIDSPKLHPIVRECRGIVLEDGSWNLVAKGFNRFFNVGEDAEDFSKFNWKNFSCISKEDGSLILLYYYQNEWHVNTSGSFGLGQISGAQTWRELFWETSSIKADDLKGLENYTLVFELCTPYNRVVRHYDTPRVYLLSAFVNLRDAWQERDVDAIHNIYHRFVDRNVFLPEFYSFSSQEEISLFLREMEDKDKTFEGVILRDDANRRYKWKTKTYVALHQLKDNGNILLPNRLVPLILAGEVDEVVAVLPETRGALLEAGNILAEAWDSLLSLWSKAREAESQKDYAMSVKNHPLSALLFEMRKKHPAGTEQELRSLWRGADDLLVKKLFEGKIFKFD